MKKFLYQLWQQQSVLPVKQQNILYLLIFIPLSWLNWIITTLKAFGYHIHVFSSHKLPGITISVGNIAIGGTGKTPLAISLSNILAQSGKSVCLLNHGYKSGLSKNDSMVLLNNKTLLPPLLNHSILCADEAQLAAQKCPNIPIVVGRNRFCAAKRFLKATGQSIDYWVVDDGFQHQQLARNFDIVLLDNHLLGNGWLYPLGRLRERPKSLRRANHIVLTRTKQKSAQYFCQIPCSTSEFKLQPLVAINSMATNDLKKNSQSTGCLTAIAQPKPFVLELEQAGYPIKSQLDFADHEMFAHSLVLNWIKSQDIKNIITTEKDYHRLPDFFKQLPIASYMAPLEATLAGELITAIMSIIPD